MRRNTARTRPGAAACLLVLSLGVHRTTAFTPALAPALLGRAKDTVVIRRACRAAACGLSGPARIVPLRRAPPSGGGWLSMQTFSSPPDFGADFLDLESVGRRKQAAPQPVQAVDFTTLSAVSVELQDRLPLRVRAVAQAGETDIVLGLDELQADDWSELSQADKLAIAVWVRLSWHRKFGRMSFSTSEPVRTSKSAFAQRVQDTIGGLYLVRARPLPFSRILRLDFSSVPASPADEAAAGGASVAQPALAEDDADVDEGRDEESTDDGELAAPVSVGGDGDWRSTGESMPGIEDADAMAEEEETAEAPAAVTARIYLQVNVRGHTRVVLVGADGRVITTAPAMDQKGVIWSRIGRFYSEPGPLEMQDLGDEPRLEEGEAAWRSSLEAVSSIERPLRNMGRKFDEEDEEDEMGRSEASRSGRRRGRGGRGRARGGGRGGSMGGREKQDAEERAAEGSAGRGGGELSVKGALMRRYRGLSGDLVEQMLSAAGIPRGEMLRTMAQEDFSRLFRVWTGWLWALNDGLFRASARGALKGLPAGRAMYSVVAWPEPSAFAASESGGQGGEWWDEDQGEEEEEEEPPGRGDQGAAIYFDSAAEGVEWYYQWAELAELEKTLQDATGRALKQMRDKKAGFADKALEAEDALLYKAQGEALLQNQQAVAQAIKRGIATVSVEDWANFGAGENADEPPMLDIEIDVTLSPAENAQRYFTRFKKLSRQAHHADTLLDQTVSQLTELIGVQDALSNVAYGEGAEAAMAAIKRLQERLESKGILKPRPGGRAAEDQAQVKAEQLLREKMEQVMMGPKIKVRGRSKGNVPDFMRFKSPSGFDVVAGRSSTENDRVTWGVARDHDLWFHARGIGGSHVVIVVPPRASVKQEDIVFAARIAATHSKAKQDTTVDVSYTARKYLRPPPQRVKKPGMVMITREKVITVKPMKRDGPADPRKGKYS